MTTTVTPVGIARPDADAAELERYGIIRVPADTYHVDGYRYGNVADAIAQAKRTERGSGSSA